MKKSTSPNQVTPLSPQEIAQVSGGVGPNRFMGGPPTLQTNATTRGTPQLGSGKGVYMS